MTAERTHRSAAPGGGQEAPRPAPTPLQYAILGLLHDQPAHGYDRQRVFSLEGDLNGVVSVGQPALYAALKDLAARALVIGVEARDGARPPRTVYSLTPTGESEFEEWARTPVRRLRQVRLDFLLKVYFARRRGERELRALVDAQIKACHDYLSALEDQAGAFAADDFGYLVVESRTSAARSTLDWLRDYRRRL